MTMPGLQELDPWLFYSEFRTGPGGDWALIPFARRYKPEPGKKSKERSDEPCFMCRDQWSTLEGFLYYKGEERETVHAKGFVVLDNKFPVVSKANITQNDIEARLGNLGLFYSRRPADGRHLVIGEPQHIIDPFADAEETKIYYANLTWMYRTVLKSLRAEGYEWAGLGKNRNGMAQKKNGGAIEEVVLHAGASQPHPHSQVIATSSFVPQWVEWTYYVWHQRFDRLRIPLLGIQLPLYKKSRDIGKDLVTTALHGVMLRGCGECLESRENRYASPFKIASDDIHASFKSPFGTMNPYQHEFRIVPYAHTSHFDDMTEEQAASFAGTLQKTMVWLGQQYGDCGYNFELRQGPWNGRHASKAFHWSFRIYPAMPELKSLKQDGFMSHLLGAAILPEPPEDVLLRNRRGT